MLARVDALSDRWVAVVVAGYLWMGAEFIGALGLLVMYQ
jgi:hypothetical protein